MRLKYTKYHPSLKAAKIAIAIAAALAANSLSATALSDAAVSTIDSRSAPLPGAHLQQAPHLTEVARYGQSLVDDGILAGLVTAVVHKDKLVHHSVHGNAKANDIFRIYSMTKPIVTAGAMMLVEEGKISLSDPISRFIPQFKNTPVYTGEDETSVKTKPANREVQVIDLMRHTSGLTYGVFGNTAVDRAYHEKGVLDDSQPMSVLVDERLASIPLLADPGSTWIYSVSVDVLGRVIEIASGQELDTFLKERFFVPLGMLDTDFYVRTADEARLSKLYGYDQGGKLIEIPEVGEGTNYLAKPNFLSGGGGLVSTTTDYLRFMRMIMRGGELDGKRYLKATTVQMMRTDQLPAGVNKSYLEPGKSEAMGFGLGFAVVLDPSKMPYPVNKGDFYWGGYANTVFFMDPVTDTVGLLMTNIIANNKRIPLRENLRASVLKALAP